MVLNSTPLEKEHELLGIFYDAVSDARFLKAVLAALVGYIEQHESPGRNGFANQGGDGFYRILRMHLKNAEKINHRARKLALNSQINHDIMQSLPVAMISLDENHRVLFANEAAGKILAQSSYWSIKNGRILPVDEKDRKAYVKQVRDALDHHQSRTVSLNAHDDGFFPTVVIIPAAQAGDEQRVYYLMAASSQETLLDEAALQLVFELSKTESKLLKHLAGGKAVEQIAVLHGVSVNTIRKQLKNIFKKTRSHSQSELVRKVYTSPALWMTHDTMPAGPVKTWRNGRDVVETQKITLSDGRVMAYRVFGDPEGSPLVYLHGLYGSRIWNYPEPFVTTAGIKLIVPARPGYGESDASTGGFLGWADDMAQLADHLALERFTVIGCCVSGGHAAACAYKMPNRVKQALFLDSIPPFQSMADFENVLPSEKVMWALARYAPRMLIGMLQWSGMTRVFADADKTINKAMTYYGPADRKTLQNPFIYQDLKLCLEENARGDRLGLAWDFILNTRPWGFDLQDITVPCHYWFGEQNAYVSSAQARRFVAGLPQVQARFFADHGHFLVFDRWNAIVQLVKQAKVASAA